MDKYDWSGVIHNARGQGKTTAMVEAVKKVGGILVVRNLSEAQRLRKDHGIMALTIAEADRHYGVTKPILFDPDAVAMLCMEYEKKLAAKAASLRSASEKK